MTNLTTTIGEFSLRHPVLIGVRIFIVCALLSVAPMMTTNSPGVVLAILLPFSLLASGLTAFWWRRPNGWFRRIYLKNTRGTESL